MSQQVHQLVKNQILFREVNERVRETVGREWGPVEFICECSNDECVDRVTLDVTVYERIRSNANLFLVAPGHEQLEVERVVDQGDGYVLVQKTVGTETVESTDPRSSDGQVDGA